MQIAILGGGFTGLTAAYDLARHGVEVTLFEGAPYVGGLAAGFKAPHWDWPVEHFYHHIFEGDTDIRALADEIGFGKKVFFRNPITAQWYNGRAWPLDGGNPLEAALNVLRFPAMPLPDRLRYGLGLAYLKYGTNDWRALEQMTAAEWAQRVLGRRAYEQAIKPLLEGKFGPYAAEVNLAWLWARFKARSFRLGYFEGGFQAFANALADAARVAGATIHTNTPVTHIQRLPEGRWRVRTAGGEAAFDRVLAAVPPSVLVHIAPDLPSAYLAHVQALKSLGAIVMVVALQHPLTPNLYWVNLDKREFPMLALVEHTNYIEPARYGGDHLVYLGDYLVPDHPYFEYDTEALFEVYEAALYRFNREYSPDWVRNVWLFKARYAQPVPPVGHSAHIPSIRTPLEGLYFASMSHVYPWDRGTNYAVRLGRQVAHMILGDTMENRQHSANVVPL